MLANGQLDARQGPSLPRPAARAVLAFWAHVGGFVTGMLLIKLLPTRKNVYEFEDY